jgi:N utilization substance protein A
LFEEGPAGEELAAEDELAAEEEPGAEEELGADKELADEPQLAVETSVATESEDAVVEEVIEEVEEEITNVAELPGITEAQVAILKNGNVEDIEDLLEMEKEDLLAIEGMGDGDADAILKLIDENVEVVEEEEIEPADDAE